MPVRLLFVATLLTIVLPLLVGVSVFFVSLPWWIDRLLRRDPDIQERLHLDISQDGLAWDVASDDAKPLRLPHFPLALAALAGLAVTAIEIATFASRSGVPHLWYDAGIIVAVIILLVPVVTVTIYRGFLCRHVERVLGQRANDRLLFAAQTIYEIGEVDRQINDA